MKVHSFVRSGLGLESVQLELSLVPGLPSVKFLGLPGPIIRESEIRLKAAIKAAGFEFPKSKQLIVQIRPLIEKRESRGLDLAVVYGYLAMTEQIPKLDIEPLYLYGEVSLFGEVLAPVDVEDLSGVGIDRKNLLCVDTKYSGFRFSRLEDLRELQPAEEEDSLGVHLEAPSLPDFCLTESQARVAALSALGKHPLLLVGGPGTGKSTLAQAVHTVQTDPSPEVFRVSQQIARVFGEKLNWRPLRGPHHTATVRSMVGGGNPPLPGEISRAHGGTLILDEFLEFDPHVQEALREPMETGQVLISRAGHAGRFPALFLLIATTNLCPCGHLNPKEPDRCECRNNRRRLYLEKLSGPIVDRFDLICASDEWSEAKLNVSLESVRASVQKAEAFRRARLLSLKGTNEESGSSAKLLSRVIADLRVSRRRQASLLKLTRTLADLDESEQVKTRHLQEAFETAFIGGVRQIDRMRSLF